MLLHHNGLSPVVTYRSRNQHHPERRPSRCRGPVRTPSVSHLSASQPSCAPPFPGVAIMAVVVVVGIDAPSARGCACSRPSGHARSAPSQLAGGRWWKRCGQQFWRPWLLYLLLLSMTTFSARERAVVAVGKRWARIVWFTSTNWRGTSESECLAWYDSDSYPPNSPRGLGLTELVGSNLNHNWTTCSLAGWLSGQCAALLVTMEPCTMYVLDFLIQFSIVSFQPRDLLCIMRTCACALHWSS